MASMNWDFDTTRPMEENYAFSKRLGSFSMNRLREERPEGYAMILRNRAIPSVTEDRELYLDALRQPLKDHEEAFMQKVDMHRATEAAGEYSTTYGILVKAVKGTKIDVRHLWPDYERDIQKLCKENSFHQETEHIIDLCAGVEME